ncbi:galectin-8-like isoform X2 [Hemitrygon akajei]|uniref:galectin-8-like isoform X2 n=1 Tax=Hemitrygon akajei TaxID=2704970 RepID=UPI003BFA3301
MNILKLYRPIVPCTAKFDEELSEESIVVIKGKLTDDPLRFDVNFQRGDHPDADILFHFNPRFKEELEKIIFNSRGPDGWGFQGEKYEKIASRGSLFKLVFMVWNNSFQISTFCSF